MKRRVIAAKKVTSNKECLKCAHENGCTLGYGNVRVLSGMEHVRSPETSNVRLKLEFPIEKKR